MSKKPIWGQVEPIHYILLAVFHKKDHSQAESMKRPSKSPPSPRSRTYPPSQPIWAPQMNQQNDKCLTDNGDMLFLTWGKSIYTHSQYLSTSKCHVVFRLLRTQKKNIGQEKESIRNFIVSQNWCLSCLMSNSWRQSCELTSVGTAGTARLLPDLWRLQKSSEIYALTCLALHPI